MLNAYEVSAMLPKDSEGYREAARILKQQNPNDVLGKEGAVNFFEGLKGEEMRFVPFNGGLGESQLHWLSGLTLSVTLSVTFTNITIHNKGFKQFKLTNFIWCPSSHQITLDCKDFC